MLCKFADSMQKMHTKSGPKRHEGTYTIYGLTVRSEPTIKRFVHVIIVRLR